MQHDELVVRRVETLPPLYARRFPARFNALVQDEPPFAIFEITGPVTSHHALEAALVEGLAGTTDLHAHLGRLEEAAVLVLLPEDLDCSTPLAVDGFDLEPLGQRLGLELGFGGRFVLLVAGDLRCRHLYVGEWSHLGVGGDLHTRLLWVEDRHGATVHVTGQATVSHLHTEHLDYHRLQFTQPPPVDVRALEHRRGACDALPTLVDLIERGAELRYLPEPLPDDIGDPDHRHTLGDLTLSFGARPPAELLTAPPDASTQPDGNLFAERPGPPGYACARLTWRASDRTLLAIGLYPDAHDRRTYDYGRFHDDGTVSMIARIVDGQWDGLKVDFVCDHETSEHFVVYREPHMVKAVSLFDQGTLRARVVYDRRGAAVDP